MTAISDSDEELQEFVPQGDAAKPALMKATQESEEESSGHTPGLLTPDAISQGPSRDISDTGKGPIQAACKAVDFLSFHLFSPIVLGSFIFLGFFYILHVNHFCCWVCLKLFGFNHSI